MTRAGGVGSVSRGKGAAHTVHLLNLGGAGVNPPWTRRSPLRVPRTGETAQVRGHDAERAKNFGDNLEPHARPAIPAGALPSAPAAAGRRAADVGGAS